MYNQRLKNLPQSEKVSEKKNQSECQGLCEDRNVIISLEHSQSLEHIKAKLKSTNQKVKIWFPDQDMCI